ncbi:MAG: hypothetical protein LBE02_01820 [Spirochaetaceae bacterium]|jgi:hypothetical protein|nr:hypothetical protein [Spirochaetaceae bacterium]
MTKINTRMVQKSAAPFFPGFRIIAALLFAAGILAAPAAAQETTGAYFIRESETGEQTIVQRLRWPDDENAARYEVVVERERSGAFAEIHRESTDRSYVDISLGPGRYRYQVRVFNLLNQFEYATNWASFSIILALRPEIAAHTPDALYIHDGDGWEFKLTGANFIEAGEAYLVPLEEDSAQPIAAKTYLPEGDKASLSFNPAELRPGAYRILVRNPGGLEASAGPVDVDLFSSSYDLHLSAGYAPLLPLYGYLFDALDKKFAPLGMDIRGAFIFLKRPWGFLGAEANISLNYLSGSGVGSGGADFSAFITGAEAGLLYRKTLPLRGFAFNARLRGGINAAPLRLVFDYQNYTSEPLTSWVPLASLGLSLEWRFLPFLYAELGADYAHLFSPDAPQPGFLRPFINVGWRYGLSKRKKEP